MDELTMWYRAQLDVDERRLRAELAEYLGTRMEYDFRFRLAEVDTNRRILDLHTKLNWRASRTTSQWAQAAPSVATLIGRARPSACSPCCTPTVRATATSGARDD
jgi:hypothetical protein